MSVNTLFEFEQSLGGKFSSNGIIQIPKNFGDAENEAISGRNVRCFSDISNRGRIRVKGKDHLKLLNGMLTNDILKLETGKGMLACILTNKGKMIADMRVFKKDGSVLIDLEPGINKKVCEHLLKFRLSYKADIEDETGKFHLLHLFGPGISGVIGERFNFDCTLMQEYDHHEANGLHFFKLNRTGETGFDLLFDESKSNPVEDMLKDKNLNFTPAGSTAMEILRIEAGIPEYGTDMDENTIPIEAGLWNALNFEKGCYVGQEVVARIKWRGRVNRHLMNFRIEGGKVPDPKAGIYSGGKQIGKITSAVISPNSGFIIGLGYIRREFSEDGKKAEILFADGDKTSVFVKEKPFFSNFR